MLNHFTDANFKDEVLDSSQPVMVYFTSRGCGPCKMSEPVVQEVAAEWGDKVKFGEFRIHENLGMAIRHGVLKAPTLVLFKDGMPVDRITGYKSKHELVSKFEKHLRR